MIIAVVYKNEKQELKCKMTTSKEIVKYFRKKEYSIVDMPLICSTYSNILTKLILDLNKRAIQKIFKDGEKYNYKLLNIGVYKGSVYFEYESLDKEFYTHGIIDKKGKIIPIYTNEHKKTNDLKKLFSFRDENCIESSKDSLLKNLLKANINWHTNYDNNKLPIHVINPQCPPRRDSQRPDGYKKTNEKEQI